MLLLLLLRLVHILSGIFWVGTMMFNTAFLFPALKDVGPDAAKLGVALTKRRFPVIMPIVALLTILSGIWLFARVSGGFQSTFMQSHMAKALSFGAACAIIAFILGVVIVRPAMVQAMTLAQSNPQRAGVLRVRADNVGRVVTALVVLAAAAMALARYI
ncbi:MAG TPA: hypothetical protein VKB45_17275 [Gemmatimonadales bacterium]|nr:hypothetical protein [Gemmatimonadales bacterium]